MFLRQSSAGLARAHLQPRPLYLVCGRKIGRVGATDRPRPWSINKTAKKSLGRRALPFTTRREPEQLPGPLRPKKTRGARIRKDGPPTAKEEEALGPHDDEGAALGGGGRLQGSPGRLLTMERTRKPPTGGGLRPRLRGQRDRRPALSPPGGAYCVSDPGGHWRLRAHGGWGFGCCGIVSSVGQSPSS